MVATLLRIRFRELGNTLVAHPAQLVGFILGSMWAASMIVFAWIGLFAVGFAGLDAVRAVVTAAGAVLVLGWTLGPLFVAGVDTTLDPAKLAPFPISHGRMMVALTAAGLTGVPGIATTAASLGVFIAYVRWPLGALAALVCVPLGVLTCVVASRLVAALSSGAGGNRKTRELFGGLALMLIILSGPILAFISGVVGAADTDLLARAQGIVGVVAWTPIGAAWAVPGDIAAGAILAALAKLAIAAATLGALWWLWQRSLAASLVSPPRSRVKTLATGTLGWFGRMPTGALGASWARSLTYWLRDPRYLRQLMVVPICPVLMLFSARGDLTSPPFVFSAVIVAALLGGSSLSDVSYDGTAFASILATGVRGRDDRTGRMLAAAAVGLPIVLVVAVVTVLLSGRVELLAAVIGASTGLLLAGYGVSAVTSAYLVMPVPAAGASPFARTPGAGFLTTLTMMGVWLGIVVLGLPGLVLAIVAAVTGQALFSWLALLVGVLLGGALLVIGIVIGGRAFDRTAPDLLARLRSMPGA